MRVRAGKARTGRDRRDIFAGAVADLPRIEI